MQGPIETMFRSVKEACWAQKGKGKDREQHFVRDLTRDTAARTHARHETISRLGRCAPFNRMYMPLSNNVHRAMLPYGYIAVYRFANRPSDSKVQFQPDGDTKKAPPNSP